MPRSRAFRILSALAVVVLAFLLWRTGDEAVPKPAPPASAAEAAPEVASTASAAEPAVEAPAREEAAASALVAPASEDLVECRFRSGGSFEPVSGTVRLPREPTTEAEPPSYPMAEGVAFLPRAFVAELAAGRDPESLVLEEAAGGAAPCIGVEELDPDLYALDFPREVVLEFHVTDLRGEPIEGAEVTVLGQSLLDLNANGPRTDAAGRLTARVRSPSRQLGYRVRKYGYAMGQGYFDLRGDWSAPVETKLGRIFVYAWVWDRRYPVGVQHRIVGLEGSVKNGSSYSLAGQGDPWSKALDAMATETRATRSLAFAESRDAWADLQAELTYRYAEPFSGSGSIALPLVPLAEVAPGDCVALLPPPESIAEEPGAVLITGFEDVTSDTDLLPTTRLFWFERLDRHYEKEHPFVAGITRPSAWGHRTARGYLVFLPPGRYVLANPDPAYAAATRDTSPALFLEGDPFEVEAGAEVRTRARFLPGSRLVRLAVVGPHGGGVALQAVFVPDQGERIIPAFRPGLLPPVSRSILVPGDYRLFVHSVSEYAARPVGPVVHFPADCDENGGLTLRLSRSDFERAGLSIQ